MNKTTTPTGTHGVSHSPGPWHQVDGRIYGPDPQQPRRTTILIADVAPDGVALTEHDEPNACLIAAAPELLAALEDILEQAQIAVQRLNDALKADARTPGNAPFYISRLQRARAAITKAKGQP